MSAQTKSPVATKAALGTWAVTMVVFGSSATTPAMNSLFQAFADQPQWLVSLINTLPSLTTLVGCLLFGAIANSKIKFKTVAIVGMLIYGIFGILPCWINDSLAAVLVIRALTGFGIGFIMPLGSTWFMRMIRNRQERGRYLSWNQAFGSGGSVVMTLLGGWLCAVNWKYTFLAYLFVFVGFVIMLICFREPKTVDEIIKEEGASAAEEFSQAKRVKLGATSWFIVVFYFCFQLFMSPGLMQLSVLMAEHNAGDAAMAGNLLTIFVLVTAIACIFGDKYIKLFGKYTMCVFFIITAAGLFCIAFGTTAWMFALGMVFVGLGCTVNFLVNFEIGLVTKAAGLAWAASLIMFATNLGNFCSSFWMGILQGIGGADAATNFPVVVCGVLMAVAGILFAVMNVANKKVWGKDAVAARELDDANHQA